MCIWLAFIMRMYHDAQSSECKIPVVLGKTVIVKLWIVLVQVIRQFLLSFSHICLSPHCGAIKMQFLTKTDRQVFLKISFSFVFCVYLFI
jgi:phosphatidylglycerophosphate synthase